MKLLFILNEAPYGNEKSYNALRLIMAIQKEHPDNEIHIFLMADSVFAALPDQVSPNGYYNIERMLESIIRNKAEVKVCTTCIQIRGLFDINLIEGIELGTMKNLANWSTEDDKVFIF